MNDKEFSSFEEDFPELSKRKLVLKGIITYSEGDITCCCTDNQRLIEAIEEIPVLRCDTRLHDENNCEKCKLYKKLGVK